MHKHAMAMVAMMMLGSAASAAPEQPKPVFNEKVAPTDVPRLVEMIRAEIEPGGRWGDVPRRDRAELDRQLDVMEKLLAGRQSLDELSQDEKVRLINAQERANAILTENDGERLVCKRHTPTGSHRPEVSCITVAQRRREQEDAERSLRNVQRSSMRAPSGQ